mmetsp:Transcript_36301/g.95716  ORF Transcript_36301/g.95716 Transcript_36301/m.95716 type:complete len:485 (+) Transcript_36301:140-1594(+)
MRSSVPTRGWMLAVLIYEVVAQVDLTPIAMPTTNAQGGQASALIDGDIRQNSWGSAPNGNVGNTDDQLWVMLDLGGPVHVTTATVTLYYDNNRRYCCQALDISVDGQNWQELWSTGTTYAGCCLVNTEKETAAGRQITVNATARFVRHHSGRNTRNNGVHWLEMSVNGALLPPAVPPALPPGDPRAMPPGLPLSDRYPPALPSTPRPPSIPHEASELPTFLSFLEPVEEKLTLEGFVAVSIALLVLLLMCCACFWIECVTCRHRLCRWMCCQCCQCCQRCNTCIRAGCCQWCFGPEVDAPPGAATRSTPASLTSTTSEVEVGLPSKAKPSSKEGAVDADTMSPYLHPLGTDSHFDKSTPPPPPPPPPGAVSGGTNLPPPPPPPGGENGGGDEEAVPPPPMLAPEHHYYEILGVSYSATDDELRKAYQKIAKKYHPDKQRGNPEGAAEAAEKFKQANRAYKVLTDSSKRQDYNDVISLLWNIAEG